MRNIPASYVSLPDGLVPKCSNFWLELTWYNRDLVTYQLVLSDGLTSSCSRTLQVTSRKPPWILRFWTPRYVGFTTFWKPWSEKNPQISKVKVLLGMFLFIYEFDAKTQASADRSCTTIFCSWESQFDSGNTTRYWSKSLKPWSVPRSGEPGNGTGHASDDYPA